MKRFKYGLIVLITLIVITFLGYSVRAAGSPVAAEGTLTVLAQGMGAPDDLALGADGTIYFGDLGVGKVLAVAHGGKVTPISPKMSAPEGIVVLNDGSLIVAEQANNKLYRLDPVTQTLSLFYAIGNATKNAGIDNIYHDSVTGDLIIPDAPTGRILRLSSDGKTIQVIASGFRRPTAVAIAPDGTIYVCDEYGQSIQSIAPDGKIRLIARIPTPDDVILDPDGNLLVNSLRGTIWRVNPATGETFALVTGLVEPHGIILDQENNLIIADAKLNQLFHLTLIAHNKTS